MKAVLLSVHGDRALVRVTVPFHGIGDPSPVDVEVPLSELNVSIKEPTTVIQVKGPRWTRQGRRWKGGRRPGAQVVTSVN